MTRNRLTDNDTYYGPITIGERSATWRPLSIVLNSGDDEDDQGCCLNLRAFGWSVRVALPQILKPHRSWVDTSMYAWASSRGGYWDVHSRRFGFSLSDGFLQVFLGPQTHDSTTTKQWSKFLPWTQWRHVRHTVYDLSGEHFYDVPNRINWAAREGAINACPTAKFVFQDFDGQVIVCTTRIEEREWRFGEGWFKWLSIFRKPRIQRTLDLEFDREVGREKGSWKGGTLGHSIEMLPGEMHEPAFRRYCAQGMSSRSGPSPMNYMGPLQPADPPSTDVPAAA